MEGSRSFLEDIVAKHIAEVLIEINKKISAITDKMESDNVTKQDTEEWVDNINDIIRSLDHVVEELERHQH